MNEMPGNSGNRAAIRSGTGAWSFGPFGLSRLVVQKRGMDARLPLRRLLVCAVALTALVVLTSACGGGSDAPGATSNSFDPPLVKYSNSLLSFNHPADWKAYPFQWAGGLHFQPMVYLSTQAVYDPCSTKGNTTSCGFPVKQLEPGGVLVTWNASNPPATGFGPGTRIRVDGHPATRTVTTGGMCSSIGADRTIDVLIQTHPFPSTPTEMTACLRGPGLAQAQASVDALLASTKLVAQ
jgi:hypothetical protein